MFLNELILLTIIAQALTYNTTYSVSSTEINYSHCTFNYQETPTTFEFINCSTQSVSSTSWNFCISRCCNMNEASHFNPSLETILACQKTVKQSSVTMIIIGVLCGLVGLFIIICFFAIKYRHAINQRLRNRIVYNVPEVYDVEWPEQTVVTHHPPLKWSKNANQNKSLQILDTPCSICLEEGTTAELICKHQYHPECIGGWLNKSYACPICRNDNIRGVKVYCKRCRWNYAVCSRDYLTSKTNDLTVYCNDCKNHKEVSSQKIEIIPKKCEIQSKQISILQIMELDQETHQQHQ